jgi:hypothetical protein
MRNISEVYKLALDTVGAYGIIVEQDEKGRGALTLGALIRELHDNGPALFQAPNGGPLLKITVEPVGE